MAIVNTLHDFVIKGIKDLRFYNADGDMVAEITNLQAFQSVTKQHSRIKRRIG